MKMMNVSMIASQMTLIAREDVKVFETATYLIGYCETEMGALLLLEDHREFSKEEANRGFSQEENSYYFVMSIDAANKKYGHL